MLRSITEHFADDREDIVHSRDVSWAEVRQARDAALLECDWCALKDVVLSTPWREFRQELRDLPQNFDSANNAADAFPTPPE